MIRLSYYNVFEEVPENVVICINKIDTNNLILSQIYGKRCYIIDCSDDWKSKQKKIIYENGSCTDSCGIINKYEYNDKCYENCSNGYFIDENDNSTKYCKCELDKCLTCPTIALKLNLCSKCNTGYYPMENDNLNTEEYINCYKKIDGYYLDKDDSIFKKCYYPCETCEIKGYMTTENYLECNLNFSIIKKNMFKYDKNKTKGKTKEEETQYYDTIIENIEIMLTSENFDTSDLDNGNDEIIETEKMNITLTTTQNQKNNINKNMTSIDLGECETKIRNHYNLSDNDTLYMKKIDINQDGMNIPKIEYDIYCKSEEGKLEKINMLIIQYAKMIVILLIIIIHQKKQNVRVRLKNLLHLFQI